MPVEAPRRSGLVNGRVNCVAATKQVVTATATTTIGASGGMEAAVGWRARSGAGCGFGVDGVDRPA